VDGTLVLETMYYADEVRRPEDAPAPRVRPGEVEMAKTLIENLTAKWDPARYHDRYRGALLDLLEKKAEGQELPEPSPERGGEVIDLMEALRQSVAATKERSGTRGSTPKGGARKTGSRKTSGARKRSTARKTSASRQAQ
jgi:DNA end-binding protein Ku